MNKVIALIFLTVSGCILADTPYQGVQFENKTTVDLRLIREKNEQRLAPLGIIMSSALAGGFTKVMLMETERAMANRFSAAMAAFMVLGGVNQYWARAEKIKDLEALSANMKN